MDTDYIELFNILPHGTCDELINNCKQQFDIFTNEQLSRTVTDSLNKMGIQGALPLPWYIKQYVPYESISVHMDGHCKYNQYSSFATLLVYLNDGFQGGETCIVDFTFPETKILHMVVPAKGGGLLLKQDVFHMSNPSPDIKYILRNDMFLII